MKKFLLLIASLVILVSCSNKNKAYDTFDHKVVENSLSVYFITPDHANQIKFTNLSPQIKKVYLEDFCLKFIFSSGDVLTLRENLGLNCPFSRATEVDIIVSYEDYNQLLEIDKKIKK